MTTRRSLFRTALILSLSAAAVSGCGLKNGLYIPRKKTEPAPEHSSEPLSTPVDPNGIQIRGPVGEDSGAPQAGPQPEGTPKN